MTVIGSAWPEHPGYRIDLVPVPQPVRVRFGDLLLAETSEAVRLTETRHVDRLYVPESDVFREHFAVAGGVTTVCPFKGEAEYWELTAVDPVEAAVAWTYRRPFDEVAGIRGYVCFHQDRVSVELEDVWPGDEVGRAFRFPVWGDQAELERLMDVVPDGEGRFVGPAHGDTPRNVVEGGQLLGEAVVAAGKTVPDQRVTSAFMTFSTAVAFDRPVAVTAEVLRRGRTFSTVEVRISQEGSFRSAALLLLGADADDLVHAAAPMPDVPGPDEAVPLDMGVLGRDLRIVDGAYDPDPDRVGPPEIHAWCRFRDDPASPHMRAALLAQSTTHWTIAAALRPHPGLGEADAHRMLSTGVMTCAIAFHDEVDVTGWLLYSNPAIHIGRGLAQGEGRVHTRDGRLVASYSCQVMIRPFARPPADMGTDWSTAM